MEVEYIQLAVFGVFTGFGSAFGAELAKYTFEKLRKHGNSIAEKMK